MARVTYGPVVDRVQGQVGGALFRRYKGTDTLSRVRAPSNPNTTRQQENRTSFTFANSFYAGLLRADGDSNTNELEGVNPFRQSWRNWASRTRSATARNGFLARWFALKDGFDAPNNIQSDPLFFAGEVSLPRYGRMTVSFTNQNVPRVDFYAYERPPGYRHVAACFMIFPGTRSQGRITPVEDFTQPDYQEAVDRPVQQTPVTFAEAVPDGPYVMSYQAALIPEGAVSSPASVVWSPTVWQLLVAS